MKQPFYFLFNLFLTRKSEWRLVFLSTTLSLLACLTLVEIYFWNKNSTTWVAPLTVFDPELGWSNVRSGKTVFKGIEYSTNSLGFRSPEIDNSRERVLIVGDSVAFGSGVNDDETISHFLNQKMPEFQVLNLAVMGYGIDQYYLTLKKHTDHTRPGHIVIVIYTVNDLADTKSNHMFGAAKPFFILDKGRLTLSQQPLNEFACTNLMKKSWTLSFFPTDALRNHLCDSMELNQRDAWSLVTALTEKIYNLALKHDSRLLYVLSPSLVGVQWDACELQGQPLSCKDYGSGFSAHYQDFNRFFQKSSYSYIDYNNHLLGRSQNHDLKTLYVNRGKDIHHYSPLGNKMLADAIFARIS